MLLLTQGGSNMKDDWKVVFVGKGNEELIDILRKQFVRFVNYKKGMIFLTIKKK